MRDAVDPWTYVVAAYAIGVGATALSIAWSWAAMRRAEARRQASRGATGRR